MRLPGRARFTTAVRKVRERLFDSAAILMYHRVADALVDPWEMAVSPADFEDHLRIIREEALPIRLSDLAGRVREGGPPRGAVAITFDDGYLDNLRVALPLLEEYDVPATIFVTTGKLRSGRDFWWDELERLVLLPEVVPARLELPVEGVRRTWELGRAGTYTASDRAADRRVPPWKAVPGTRLALYYELHEAIRGLAEVERARVLDALASWSPAETIDTTPYETVSMEELRVLGEGPLIDIGAHSVSHPFLSTLAVPEQEREILSSRDELQAQLSRPITAFSYPHGDYATETHRIVRSAFDCACTIDPVAVDRWSDPHLLPRLSPSKLDGEAFTERVIRRIT